jgi:Fe-S-cluster-containing dehydrogenase component
MTDLPASTQKKLGLVIDLDTCVGCQACVTSCKEWNTGGYSAPLSDHDPYGADPSGAFLNRVHSYEMEIGGRGRTVHFPRSCLHCEEPDCVTVCPPGRATSGPRTGSCWSTRHLHRLQAVLVGLPLRRAGIRPR